MAPNTPMPSSFDEHPEFYSESTLQKLKRRFREEPLVPVGILLTVGALFGATRAMNRNDHAGANMMFRRRIYAQGFTILCLLAGSAYYGKDREKRKEYEKQEKDRINAIKRKRWLAELDVRDAEDKAAKENFQRVRERNRAREEAVVVKSRTDAAETEPPDSMVDMADTNITGREEGKRKDGLVDQVRKRISGSK